MRHVTLTCKNHTHLRWNCKAIACPDGTGYNGARSIFYCGTHQPGKETWELTVTESECPCPPSDLIWAPEEDGKDLGL